MPRNRNKKRMGKQKGGGRYTNREQKKKHTGVLQKTDEPGRGQIVRGTKSTKKFNGGGITGREMWGKTKQ